MPPVGGICLDNFPLFGILESASRGAKMIRKCAAFVIWFSLVACSSHAQREEIEHRRSYQERISNLNWLIESIRIENSQIYSEIIALESELRGIEERSREQSRLVAESLRHKESLRSNIRARLFMARVELARYRVQTHSSDELIRQAEERVLYLERLQDMLS